MSQLCVKMRSFYRSVEELCKRAISDCLAPGSEIYSWRLKTDGNRMTQWNRLVLALLVAGTGLVGCVDEADETSPDPDTGADAGDAGTDTALPDTTEPPPPPEYPDLEPGGTSMRRLTQTQLRNVIYDLFGEEIVIPPIAEPDVEIGGLLSVGASSTTYGARGVESLEDASFAIAEQAMRNEDIRDAIVPCSPTDTVDSACAEQFIAEFGRMAWRRSLSSDEVARIVGIADTAAAELDDFHEGLGYAIAAILQSPNFVFRIELGEPSPDGAGRRFTDLELASRLSFFLWNTGPDQELLDAAEAGELSTDEGLRAQAERLLASPRARLAMRNFFSEFLELHELDHLAKDPALFEHYSTLLGPDAAEETLLLLEHIVFDAESDYRDLMTTRETFVNPRLSSLYGIPAPVPDGFGYVELPEDGGRAGLLGHASMMSLHAHPVSSSATLRGVWVRTVLLCQQIPPPPVNVDTSIPEPSGEAPTLRDRVAEHLENPACAGCHNLTDPIGLGLENFDGIGRWRDLDNGVEIDASGQLDGVDFADAVELGHAIRDHEDFAACLVQTLTRYATGRVEERDERPVLDVLSEQFAAHEYRVQPLLMEIVMSPFFREAGEPR